MKSKSVTNKSRGTSSEGRLFGCFNTWFRSEENAHIGPLCRVFEKRAVRLQEFHEFRGLHEFRDLQIDKSLGKRQLCLAVLHGLCQPSEVGKLPNSFYKSRRQYFNHFI